MNVFDALTLGVQIRIQVEHQVFLLDSIYSLS